MTTYLRHIDAETDTLELADLLSEMGVTQDDCVALRMHRGDGTFKDLAWGGTHEERKAALAALKAGKGGNLH